MNFTEIFKKPFAEQVEFFRSLIQLPLQDWRDLDDRYRQLAVYVSGVTAADMLADIVAALDAAIAEGRSLQWFREQFAALIANRGWGALSPRWNDPGYRDWRVRLVYQEQTHRAYSAGRWTQLNTPALVAPGMVWVYFHSEIVVNARPMHLAWGTPPMALPPRDPWWLSHYPPRGFGCRCYVIAMREEIARARGYRFSRPQGEGQTYQSIDRKTGAVANLPVGVDPGFSHTLSFDPLDRGRELAAVKLEQLPANVADALRKWLAAKGLPA